MHHKGTDWFRRYSWAVLTATLGVVVWGAYVRASGSGAGCGSHWPTCHGEVMPRPKSLEMLVELLHRTTSAVLTVLILGQLTWALRLFRRGHLARKASVASCVFLVIEALVGAALVKLDLVVRNASPARGIWMAAHLVNTFALLGSLALTAYFARPMVPERRKLTASARALLAGGLLGTLLVGATGAIAALGDTLFPAQSLASGIAADFGETAHLFLRLRMWHPVAAVIVGIHLAATASLTPSLQGARTRLPGRMLIATVALQFAIGLLNLFLLAPIGMQLVHLLAADLVWIVLVVFAAAATESQATT